jgi:hypothetical protein
MDNPGLSYKNLLKTDFLNLYVCSDKVNLATLQYADYPAHVDFATF